MDELKKEKEKENSFLFFSWVVFCVIINGFALLLSRTSIGAGMEVFEQANDPMNLIWVFVTILGMTIIILLIAKFWKKQLIQLIILFAVGYTSFYIFLPLFSLVISNLFVTVFFPLFWRCVLSSLSSNTQNGMSLTSVVSSSALVPSHCLVSH